MKQTYTKTIRYIFIILLVLVLASFSLLCNLYARYTTSASGSDGARVARFNITETKTDFEKPITLDMAPGEYKEYSIEVTNNSEVAIRYTIDAENVYNNLPLTLQMLDSNNNLINSGEISANDTTLHTYKLKISWDKSKNDVNYINQLDQIIITLKAEQID